MRRCSIASTSKPAVVRAPTELDALSAPGFRDHLATLLSYGGHSIVVEMHDVAFIDSSGMGALVAARKLAAERGGGLQLHGVGERVAAALRLAGLTEFLGVTEGT